LLIKFSSKYLDILYLCGFSTIPLPLLSFFWVFFISSILILHMSNTRNHNANAENNGENNDVADPPPPPPPTLEQVLAMRAQMLQTMQQTMVNMQNA
jgi:hypothetical protein